MPYHSVHPNARGTALHPTLSRCTRGEHQMESKTKTLLATAAIVIASATGAAASNISDAILYELSRKFPDLEEDAAIDFIGDDEITFYSGNRHRSCRIKIIPHPKLDEIKSVSFNKCRVIHG